LHATGSQSGTIFMQQADKRCVKGVFTSQLYFFSIGKLTSLTHASDYSADGPWIFDMENVLVLWMTLPHGSKILHALAASCLQSRWFFASMLREKLFE
jgi:hypothetical protein